MMAMMMSPLGKLAGVAILIAALLGYREVLIIQRDHARANADRAKAAMMVCAADKARLEAVIADTNRTIAGMAAAGAREVAAANEREHQAAIRGVAAVAHAAESAARLRHPQIDASCAAAMT